MTLLLIALTMLAQTAIPAASVKLTPRTIGEIDLAELHGLPRQMSWSPDGAQLYLQTYEQNRDASVKELFHYLVATKDAAVTKVTDAPAWAVDYWTWKSAQASPGDPSFKIAVDQTKKLNSANAMPMGDQAAKGGGVDPTGGASSESVMEAARLSQTVSIITMRLKGEVVGEWTDQPMVPGLTFGWGPKGTGLIAYADKNSGRLMIMDHTGAKQRIEGTKGIILPAWTADGARLAYLEGHGDKKYAVVIADVRKP